MRHRACVRIADTDSLSIDELFAMFEEEKSDILSDATARTVNVDVCTSRCATGKPVSKRKKEKAKAKTNLTSKCGKQADDVLAEFEDLLKRDGYSVGVNADGTARKYARYMKMLFDHGVFRCRADFFEHDSREKAHAFYRSIAQETASKNGGKTSAGKLFLNFRNGFDKFVMLAHFESEYKPPASKTAEAPVCDSPDAVSEPPDLEEDISLDELLSYFT